MKEFEELRVISSQDFLELRQDADEELRLAEADFEAKANEQRD